MQIENYGRGTFLVHCHGETFTVDVLCHEGSGACDCVHYLARIKPEVERHQVAGTFEPGRTFKCPHIEACDQHLLQMFKAELNKIYPDTEPI